MDRGHGGGEAGDDPWLGPRQQYALLCVALRIFLDLILISFLSLPALRKKTIETGPRLLGHFPIRQKSASIASMRLGHDNRNSAILRKLRYLRLI